MNSAVWILVGAFVIMLILKRIGQVSAKEVSRLLELDPVIIDVRTESEFEQNQLPGVINIPLDRIGADLAGVVSDQDRILLLHCFSGSRSAAARRVLMQAGYTNVYNLGTYGRARKLLSAAQRTNRSAQ